MEVSRALPVGLHYAVGFKPLTAWVSLETFLEEVLLWKTPFERAFWMKGIVSKSPFWAPSKSFLSIASRTFLIEVFTVDSTWRFRTLLLSFCFALLTAD